jgi:ribonuclease VapC
VIQDVLDRRADAYLSVINLGEVYYRVGKVQGEEAAQSALQDLLRLSWAIVPATDDRVFAAATLKMRYPISYADAFAAASAAEYDAALLTGDPELEQLGGSLKIERLRRSQS